MNKENITSIWITWEVQPRNRSMSSLLGVPLYEILLNGNRFIRYPILLFKTLSLIIKEKPQLIFVQNPSIVLALFAILLKILLNKRIIVDAHNAGIFPLEGSNSILNTIARFISKKADVTIVSNKYLANIVDGWNGKSFVMPDPLPQITPTEETLSTEKGKKGYILFICTWASDEPYREVINAANSLQNIDIYITGNFRKKISVDEQKTLPQSIKLLGFVSEKDYIKYFSNSIAAIDLTTRDNCLVCGAYEGAALGIPTILSDSQINREVFTHGYLYTENNSADITRAIQTALERREHLKAALMEFKTHHQNEIRLKANEFKDSYM